MVVKVNTATLLGIEGKIVIAEADFSGGLPAFDIVGLPDAAVKEAKERVKAAIRNSEFEFPAKKAVINLAPADLKKEGTQFDLPIAIAALAGTGQLKADFSDYVFLGELGLSGEIRSVSGILPAVIGGKDEGITKFIVPFDNREEAALVDGVEIYGAKNLAEVFMHFTGEKPIEKTCYKQIDEEESSYGVDFKEVKGQEKLRRGVEIAVAGGHNVLMVGSPGSGKSMIAKRIPTIMPPMSFDEMLEVTKIHSVAGVLKGKAVTKRPFRAPHHSASAVSIVGGGSKAKPGEISLAHRGVLFLDELPEYKKDVIEAMRQPIEDNQVTVARATGSFTYPSNVMLVCAMNPCRCGYYGDGSKKCRCSESDVLKYLSKVSGPMMDRIDIQLEAKSVSYDDLQKPDGENSESMRKRIEKAREIQKERYKNENVSCNADLSGAQVEKYCVLGDEERMLLEQAFKQMNLSARAYTRILKVARTIADLDSRESIDSMDIAEAIGYRNLDKKLWK